MEKGRLFASWHIPKAAQHPSDRPTQAPHRLDRTSMQASTNDSMQAKTKDPSSAVTPIPAPSPDNKLAQHMRRRLGQATLLALRATPALRGAPKLGEHKPLTPTGQPRSDTECKLILVESSRQREKSITLFEEQLAPCSGCLQGTSWNRGTPNDGGRPHFLRTQHQRLASPWPGRANPTVRVTREAIAPDIRVALLRAIWRQGFADTWLDTTRLCFHVGLPTWRPHEGELHGLEVLLRPGCDHDYLSMPSRQCVTLTGRPPHLGKCHTRCGTLSTYARPSFGQACDRSRCPPSRASAATACGSQARKDEFNCVQDSEADHTWRPHCARAVLPPRGPKSLRMPGLGWATPGGPPMRRRSLESGTQAGPAMAKSPTWRTQRR